MTSIFLIVATDSINFNRKFLECYWAIRTGYESWGETSNGYENGEELRFRIIVLRVFFFHSGLHKFTKVINIHVLDAFFL